jgi:hypothetical protein
MSFLHPEEKRVCLRCGHTWFAENWGKATSPVIGTGFNRRTQALNIQTVHQERIRKHDTWAKCSSCGSKEVMTAKGVADQAASVEAKGLKAIVRFDGTSVTILKTGVLVFDNRVREEEHIPLGSIVAVEMKKANSVRNGFIRFTVSGGDNHKITFKPGHSAEFLLLRSAVESAVKHGATPGPIIRGGASAIPPPPVAGSGDSTKRLAELATMRDQGLITADDFEVKKAKILDEL